MKINPPFALIASPSALPVDPTDPGGFTLRDAYIDVFEKLEGTTKQLLSTGFYRLCNPKGLVM